MTDNTMREERISAIAEAHIDKLKDVGHKTGLIFRGDAELACENAIRAAINEQAAQSVAVEDTVLPIANAYESGIGHCNDNLCNPYKEGSAEAFAYDYGKEFGKARGISQSVPVVGEPVAYLKADEDGKVLWSEDCVCEDAVWAGVDSEFGEYSLPVYRKPPHSITAQELTSLRARLERAEDVLRTLASDLGAGGYNAESVDAEVFEHKIRSGVNMLLNPLINRLEQAEKERDALRKDATNAEIGAAVQRAARELPDGYDIFMQIENGSASVQLYREDTKACMDMDVDADNRLAAEIHAAIDAAIAQGKGE